MFMCRGNCVIRAGVRRQRISRCQCHSDESDLRVYHNLMGMSEDGEPNRPEKKRFWHCRVKYPKSVDKSPGTSYFEDTMQRAMNKTLDPGLGDLDPLIFRESEVEIGATFGMMFVKYLNSDGRSVKTEVLDAATALEPSG